MDGASLVPGVGTNSLVSHSQPRSTKELGTSDYTDSPEVLASGEVQIVTSKHEQNALPFLALHVANLQASLARFLAGMLEVDENAVADLQDLHVIAQLLPLGSTQLSAHRLQLHDDLFVAAAYDEIRVAFADVVPLPEWYKCNPYLRIFASRPVSR